MSALPRIDQAAPRTLSLGGAARVFAAAPTARILAAVLLVGLLVRSQLGPLGPWDAAAALGNLAFQPLREWLIHVFLLHFRPRQVRGRTIDLVIARKHRAHHREPDRTDLVFMPLRGLAMGFFGDLAFWWLVAPTPGAMVSGVLSTVALGLHYEWIHYLCHAPYRPQGAWFKARWRHHRLHHYKSEHWWFGVSLHLADRLLRTTPDPASVPTSATARDLHGGGV